MLGLSWNLSNLLFYKLPNRFVVNEFYELFLSLFINVLTFLNCHEVNSFKLQIKYRFTKNLRSMEVFLEIERALGVCY